MFVTRLLTTLVTLTVLAACGQSASTDPADSDGVNPPPVAGGDGPCSDSRPGFKNAYFGDLHTHTNLSIDAYFFNSLNGPREALRFAKGEPAGLPVGDDDPHTQGRTVQLDQPLDFAAITDHAESIGNFEFFCTADGTVEDGTNPVCNALGDQIRANIRGFVSGDTNPALALAQGLTAELPTTRLAWDEIQQINNEEHVPCEFTTMHAYEFTPNAFGQAIHRNVFFRNDTVPDVPFPAVDATSNLDSGSTNVEWELFDHLKSACVDVDGCEVFTIAHNSNQSDGRMYRPIDPATGLPPARDNQPLTLADATLRADLERGFEITQHKGQSECAVGISGGLLESDETRCDFEVFKHVCDGDADDPPECALYCTGEPNDPPFCQAKDTLFAVELCDTTDPSGSQPANCTASNDYLRDIFTQGLVLRDRLEQVNPYRMGISASTDNHNGTPGNVAEQGFTGHGGVLDNDPVDQLGQWGCIDAGMFDNADPNDPDNCPGRLFQDRARPFNPGGLTGAWAAENTRDAIWNAVRDGETWGTSGPRIKLRMTASWDTPPADVVDRLADGQVPSAQSGLPGVPGVAMGADLPARTGDAPTLAVWAMQDPNGNPLQLLQIIKGWADNTGERHIQIFDVASTESAVSLPRQSDCAVNAADHPAQLSAVWTDPAFNPNQHAFYYARVVEIPSCRFNTHVCLTRDVQCDLLDPSNGVFPADTGLQGYEGCCLIESEQTADGLRFSGTPTFHTITERAWSSPVWYVAER